jgi:hypothetical protein
MYVCSVISFLAVHQPLPPLLPLLLEKLCFLRQEVAATEEPLAFVMLDSKLWIFLPIDEANGVELHALAQG